MADQLDIGGLWRHRPFQIAVAWEAVCIVVAVVLIMEGRPETLAIGAILAGVAPMALVLLRFLRNVKATDNASDRSKDLVQ